MARQMLAFLIVLLGCGLLSAEPPEPIRLTLHPQPIESPALKYVLFPTEPELKPGNAATILLRLPWEQTQWMHSEFPKLHEWEDRPLTAPEWKDSQGVLPESFYREMKRAAFRRDAHWEYPIQEDVPLHLILLPDVQGLRVFLGQGLAARIRYHITRGELDQAREGILVGLANARHMARTPFYVNQLVARAIHNIMLGRVDELVSQPDSPNLYWALSTLPNSLLEMDRAAGLEAQAFAIMLPAATELDRQRPVEEWRKMSNQLLELLETLGDVEGPAPKNENPSLVDRLLGGLNNASRLRRTGFVKHARAELADLLDLTDEEVADMSDEEAAVRWYVARRLRHDQMTAAVLRLPPHEAWPRLKQLQSETEEWKAQTGAGETFLNPTSLYVSSWSLQRKIAALRIVEAVRHHLATHDGDLPKTLDAIEAVPIPLDPMTGAPFRWSVDEQTATLAAPPLPADMNIPPVSVKMASLVYELTVE